MCPRHLSSILSLAVRRMSPPAHLAYPWQRPAHKRNRPLGAAIVDPIAWDKAWREAMPADQFTSTTYAKETP